LRHSERLLAHCDDVTARETLPVAALGYRRLDRVRDHLPEIIAGADERRLDRCPPVDGATVRAGKEEMTVRVRACEREHLGGGGRPRKR
jgi:hypothetical protein